MKIFIQNMVSLRSKMLVKSELKKLGLPYRYVTLGVVSLIDTISEESKNQLQEALHQSGLEVMNDEKAKLIEKIIKIIVEMIHYTDEAPKINFSNFLSEKLNIDYYKLSEIFSKTKGMTIEHFIKIHKIESIKELIIYNELNLTEISYKMHYSSVAHLSAQFKQVVGLSPTAFKNLSIRRRNNLEDL